MRDSSIFDYPFPGFKYPAKTLILLSSYPLDLTTSSFKSMASLRNGSLGSAHNDVSELRVAHK